MTPEQSALVLDAVWQAVNILDGRGLRGDRVARASDCLKAGLQMAGLPLTDPDLSPHREPEWPERGEP